MLRLYDVPTEQEVETFNLSTTQICYNTIAFKAVAIGGTVSEALVSLTFLLREKHLMIFKEYRLIKY